MKGDDGWMMNPTLLAREPLRELPKTVHGGQGWRLKDVEDYSHNLNPFGPPEDIGEIVKAAASDVGHYPDDGCAELKGTISKKFGVKENGIIIGAGSSDIIRMFPNTFFGPGDKAVISSPSFAEYSHQCRIAGAGIVWNPLNDADDFRIDYGTLSERCRGAKAVYICNPNNPTGRIEPRDRILGFVEECAERDVLVFLDETLLELVPGYKDITCSGYVGRYPNLLVAGSLTKSFAIPGIRIGFGFGSEEIVAEMEKVRMTWNVGQVEQTVANVLIRDRMDHVHRAADIMQKESVRMHRELTEIGLRIRPTDSYFFFDSVSPLGTDGKEFAGRMQENGIVVRDCASFGKPFESYIRFCVKDRERNDRFVSAAERTLKSLER